MHTTALTFVTGRCHDRRVDSRCESDVFIDETRKAIELGGAASLAVTDLDRDDLPHLWWTGNPAHIRGIASILERVAAGEVAYLAVRAPSGAPVAVGAIDYTKYEGAGMLYRLVTHRSLRSLGIGTRLIGEAEERIARRGLTRAVMADRGRQPPCRCAV